eukprot:TRINITY_DN7573_c0_g1_i1.p1 TRINITY_DN7573_c0_g1~~TRINITY_DN7573_c0_g1_i1.p1  ORF type:complete len:243 (+),score=68.30 TRINITY_DN7573_c0_g1_i1:250-978(+)
MNYQRASCVLNTGNEMPSVILATQMVDATDVAEYVSLGIKTGCRHIDTAWIYGNEEEVGKGLSKCGVERSKLFVTNRIWAMPHRPESVADGLESSLKNLGTDYVDLCLMHWPAPFGSAKDPRATSLLLTWKVMERLFKSGKAKAIGISNLSPELLSSLLTTAEIQPAVCQADCIPSNPQSTLQDLCSMKNIQFWASPPCEKTEEVPGADRNVTIWVYNNVQNFSSNDVPNATETADTVLPCY